MPGHEHEELTERLPESAAPGAPGVAPMLGFASAVGNRSLARAVAAGTAPRTMTAPGGRLVVARAPTVTPTTTLGIARRDLSENDKGRLRSMVLGRINGAIPQLKDPKKTDVPRIARHLKPIENALYGFAADGEAQGTMESVASEVRTIVLALESSSGTVKSAVGRARTRWAAAQRHLGAARGLILGEIQRLDRAAKKAKAGEPPDTTDTDQYRQDMSHLRTLATQVGNADKDLAQAPRNEESLAQVLDDNVGLLDEIASMGALSFAPAQNEVDRAEEAFTDGVAALAPFAGTREDFLREMRQSLQTAANKIAGLVGDAEVEVEPDPDADPPAPPDPAPSPNPLPPPPPPPPGTAP